MNKQTAQQYLPLIQAFAEGRTLQYKDSLNNKWLDATDLSFALAPERYRIKPEPIKQEFYYIIHKDDNTITSKQIFYVYKDFSGAQEYLKKIDPNGENYVIMRANAKSIESV
jgi:hypothetical protein